MLLNGAGEMVRDVWLSLPEHNPGLIQDVFVVMPNHFHGVIGLIDPHIGRGQGPARTSSNNYSANRLQADKENAKLIGVPDIVRKFKTLTMRDYRRGVIEKGWPRYDGHLWKRSYADHIIETERDLENHRAYTFNNPLKWHLDELNPGN